MARFKLVQLDNKTSVGQRFIGKIHEIRYDGVKAYFGNLYTSYVRSIVHEDDYVTITTRNSIYIFRKEYE